MANTNAVASQAPKVLPTPEQYWKHWEGQRKINGLLFEANKSLIAALAELKKVLELNANNAGLRIDLNPFDRAIQDAKQYAEQVPAVDPPGCATPPY